MEQVADGMWLGRGTDVNWMIVRDGSDLTLVDAGYPADIARLEADLRSIGRGLGDIRAVLVTHAHIDHIGGLQGLLSRHDVPVLMAAQELPLATGEQEKPGSGSELVRMAWRPNVAMWLGRVIRSGALHDEPLRGPQTRPGDGRGRPLLAHDGDDRLADAEAGESLVELVGRRGRVQPVDEPETTLAEGQRNPVRARLRHELRPARGGVVVVIAHRPSALAAVDLVLVMARGAQQAFGPKDDVLSKVLRREQSPAPAPLKVAQGG